MLTGFVDKTEKKSRKRLQGDFSRVSSLIPEGEEFATNRESPQLVMC
jgi:hypothetical protein